MTHGIALLAAAALVGGTAAHPEPTAPPVVVVHAKDFSYVAPKTIKAGANTFHLVNDGKEVHHLTIMKLAAGKTMGDFAAAMKKPGPPPSWVTSVGGPNGTVPGASSDATLTLEAGNYILLCFVPSPGETTPHVMKGMLHALTVLPGTSLATEPAADVTVTLADYGFTIDKPLTPGHHEVKVVNTAEQTHEVVLMELKPGKTLKDMSNWIERDMMKGPPPGRPIGGMANLDKGRTGSFAVELHPGHYGMICFVPDAKDGKPHSMHGMQKEIEVAAK
jgi:uncharacterized cupredoxin-like copper-binding protein